MYDDGTHGDEIANDKIFTNDEVLLRYDVDTNSYILLFVDIDVIYKNNDQEVHTERFSLTYISVNTGFINGIDMPNTYKFDNEDYLFTDTFIYYNKYNNWAELGGGISLHSYIISKSLLYDFWGENIINNQNDKNLYMQVDFSDPSGQFLLGQDVGLGLSGCTSGVVIHEILHLWIPSINDYLGLDYSDTHSGHHANIFRRTSGFLYSSWSRENGVFCKNSLDDITTDSDGNKYLHISYYNDYERCQRQSGGSNEILSITTIRKLHF